MSILLATIATTVAVWAVHESGHVATGRLCGWHVAGLAWRWWGGLGIKMEMRDPADLWKVSMGGPAANGIIALASLALVPVFPVWAAASFTLNGSMMLLQLIPFGPFDGGQIIKSWRALREGRNDD